MWIFGPLPCSTISPVTVTPASACASVVTVSPSTSSRAGRVIVSPASPARRLTVNVSPTPTLCCVPPALTTAYTTDSSIEYLCPARTTGTGPGAGRAARASQAAPAGALPVAQQPDQRTRAPGCRSNATRRGPRQAGGPAGRVAARRRRGRATGVASATTGSATGNGATTTAGSATRPSTTCAASTPSGVTVSPATEGAAPSTAGSSAATSAGAAASSGAATATSSSTASSSTPA